MGPVSFGPRPFVVSPVRFPVVTGVRNGIRPLARRLPPVPVQAVTPAAPVLRYAIPTTHFIQDLSPSQLLRLLGSYRFAPGTTVRLLTPTALRTVRLTEGGTWQYVDSTLSGKSFTERQSTAPRQRWRHAPPVKRPPSTPPTQAPIVDRGKRPQLEVPKEERGQQRLPKRRTSSIETPIAQTEPEHRGVLHTPKPDVGARSPRPNTEIIAGEETSPLHTTATISPSNKVARPSSDTLTTPASITELQAMEPGIGGRLWNLNMTQAFLRYEIARGTAPRNDKSNITRLPAPTPQGSMDTVQLTREAATSSRSTSSQRSRSTDIDENELAGSAGVQALLHQNPDMKIGRWFRQLLVTAQSESSPLHAYARQAVELRERIAEAKSPDQVLKVLKTELARVDGELHVAPLPHNLPNMAELSREASLGAQLQSPYGQQNPHSQTDSEESEQTRQVRQELKAAGYIDEAQGHVRKFNNADDGKAFLQFLAQLAPKHNMRLIEMINFVNDKIEFGPPEEPKGINATIRSMDPGRWDDKYSEVLLHPLMGRANLAINILDLIERNEITMDEVIDMLRIGTNGDILERLEVELEAAQIYRDNGEWWESLWLGQDAESLKPGFDDLLAQIRTAVADLKDVLAFVASLETGTA